MSLMEQLIIQQVLNHLLLLYYYLTYLIEIFFAALEKKYYKCWLGPKTDLPMIYIDDCIRGTVRLRHFVIH